MELCAGAKLVEGDAPVFARNRLVVIVPKTNPARIGRLPDLARRGTKVVLAAEAVPVGKYSREALQKLAGARASRRSTTGGCSPTWSPRKRT